ncbi:MAG: hypothetical protein JSV84_16225 [Gemmatimonadota bacterium]|nr:MAG: hypothetical protein JSV84_16225 [Gemmatimonadota bacterium]
MSLLDDELCSLKTMAMKLRCQIRKSRGITICSLFQPVRKEWSLKVTILPRKERTYTLILLTIFCLGGSFACGKNRSEQRRALEEHPTYEGIFRMALYSPQILDPIFIDDIYESSITNQNFDGLLTFDGNLRPVPAIAKEWIVSPDRKTYTFILRKGVTFQNGQELSADDCVYSFTRIFDPSLPAVSIARDYLNEIDGAEEYSLKQSKEIRGLKALDTSTLEIVLSEPSPTFLTALATDNTKIVPKEEISKRGASWFGEHPIGTGPFKFISWTKNHRIVLEANLQYFGGRPYLDRLIFEVPFTYDENESIEKFFNGALETIAVPVGKTDQFTEEQGYTLIKRLELSFEFIGFNVQLSPVHKRMVRQAIAHALNREKMIALDSESFLSPSGILPPGMLGYSPAHKVFPYDPELAGRLFNDTGLTQGNEPLKLEYWGVGTKGQNVYETDRMIKKDLALIGIDLEVRYEDWLDFDRRITEGRAQLFSMSLMADIPDPVTFLYSSFHSKSKTNLYNYQNTKVDSILEKAKEELNPFQRIHMSQEAEDIILKDAPVIPLDHVITIFALQPSVKAMVLSPYGLADISMEEIWISTEDSTKQRDISTLKF